MGDVLNRYQEALVEYEKTTSVTRKLIVYQFKCKAYIWHPTEERVIYKSSQGGSEISFCDGTAVGIAATVVEETEFTQSTGKPHYSYKVVASSLPKGMQKLWTPVHGERVRVFMDWTQEREDFFARIGRGIEAVILQLATLDNPKDAAMIADTGKLPPLLTE